MSNKKLYNVAVITGSYQSNGQEKKNWLNVGTVYENDKGNKFLMLRATFNPAAIERQQGQDSIPLYFFEPKYNQQQNTQTRGNRRASSNWEPGNNTSDDFPF